MSSGHSSSLQYILSALVGAAPLSLHHDWSTPLLKYKQRAILTCSYNPLAVPKLADLMRGRRHHLDLDSGTVLPGSPDNGPQPWGTTDPNGSHDSGENTQRRHGEYYMIEPAHCFL